MIDRKIGEVFYSQVLKKWLRVREDAVQYPVWWAIGCEKCAFNGLACWDENINRGVCMDVLREDGKNVHFEETEAPFSSHFPTVERRPKMLEHKIGEVFYSKILKKWLKVCEDSVQHTEYLTGGCDKCAFFFPGCSDEDSDRGECSADRREDGKYVHFEETDAPQEGGER